MKLAIVILTMLGVLAAGSAALVVQTMKSRPGASMTEVLVAQSDLPASTCLTAEHVKREPVPTPALPRGCLIAPNQAIGRYLIAPILKGQVVTESSLVTRGSLTEKLYMLPAGMTVATVAVPSRSANGGLLYSGCYVHVFATLREGFGSQAKSISGTLFKAMQVWSIGDEPGGLAPTVQQEQEKDKKPASSASGTIKVSLLATEEQANILQMVAERGAVNLTVRNPREVAQSDPQTELVADENLRKALGLAPDEPVAAAPVEPAPAVKDVSEIVAAPAPPPKPPRTVIVILGQKKTEETFPADDDENGRNQ